MCHVGSPIRCYDNYIGAVEGYLSASRQCGGWNPLGNWWVYCITSCHLTLGLILAGLHCHAAFNHLLLKLSSSYVNSTLGPVLYWGTKGCMFSCHQTLPLSVLMKVSFCSNIGQWSTSLLNFTLWSSNSNSCAQWWSSTSILFAQGKSRDNCTIWAGSTLGKLSPL